MSAAGVPPGTRYGDDGPDGGDGGDGPEAAESPVAVPEVAARVLVAEDDPVMLAMYGEVLRQSGYATFSANDGGEAVRVFEAERPPLVLLDLLMPVSDGLEVCRAIRALASPDEAFVLVITARDGGDVLGAVLDAGADDFMAKPVTAEQLQARVTIARRSVAQRRARRAAEEALARAQWLAGIGETSLALQHEINNPLTALLGNAALLEMQEYTPEEEREFVATIVEQAKRIGDVVQRLSSLKNPRSVSYVTGTKMLDLSPRESGLELERGE